MTLLAVAIARRYGGLISLDGPLPAPPLSDDAALSALDSIAGRQARVDRTRATIMSLPGRWHEISYRTAGGNVAIYHVVDADLLTSWLQHPHFRMVK
jgi:hypothetical protein